MCWASRCHRCARCPGSGSCGKGRMRWRAAHIVGRVQRPTWVLEAVGESWRAPFFGRVRRNDRNPKQRRVDAVLVGFSHCRSMLARPRGLTGRFAPCRCLRSRHRRSQCTPSSLLDSVHFESNCVRSDARQFRRASLSEISAPQRIRTSDHWIRSPVLYPAELGAQATSIELDASAESIRGNPHVRQGTAPRTGIQTLTCRNFVRLVLRPVPCASREVQDHARPWRAWVARLPRSCHARLDASRVRAGSSRARAWR
jgi:hypothetical protein